MFAAECLAANGIANPIKKQVLRYAQDDNFAFAILRETLR
jgi:hypothetical protein